MAQGLGAVTLEELRRDPNLTPERLAHHFADFKYEFHQEIQRPEVFLASQKGDCDDFATLAMNIPSEKDYHTRLIFVLMPGILHAVCSFANIGP